MTEDITERKHKALYALFIGAQLANEKKLTTAQLYDHASEFRDVELLKSKEDTAALLSELRDQGLVAHEKDGRTFLNWLSDEGIGVLEKLDKPDGIEDPDE